MDEVNIKALRSFVSPVLFQWLREGQPSSEDSLSVEDKNDEFFSHLTEADLAELDEEEHVQDENIPDSGSYTSEFKHSSEAELKRLVENNTNSNTKRSTSTWINRFEKWAEHRRT